MFGGTGDDSLSGSDGSDRFVFSGNNGQDTIFDFEHGVDTIEIHGYGVAINSFADLNITQHGSDVWIDLGADVAGAGVIVLAGVSLAGLDASDFLFT
ncbi:calcium-binding protein [Defluviicoccus vanus]|uniref:Calcium-binding protein n=1 Tax=Defluviicoccus vanus TaxID=111831 RepID=A0A7H1N5S9_9PROT|nr:hypothetical protein HQ394_01595 [Defluviicoccus vanus]